MSPNTQRNKMCYCCLCIVIAKLATGPPACVLWRYYLAFCSGLQKINIFGTLVENLNFE